VISNAADAAGLARASEFGLTAICMPSQGIDRVEYDRMLIKALRSFDPALICMAGFMRILSPELLKAYPSRILNIHPALLPSFRDFMRNDRLCDMELKSQVHGPFSR